MRDQKTKEAFIKYLQKCTDERFFQALYNFCFIRLSKEKCNLTLDNLHNVEADRELKDE